jgi:phage/plasmid-associated DNA primase
MMGPVYGTVIASALIFRPVADPSGPNPALTKLRGKRATFAPDNEETKVHAGSLFRALVGDSLSSRSHHEQEGDIRMQHTPIIPCNEFPNLPKSQGSWRRVLPFTFRRKFVADPRGPMDRPLDLQIRKKLLPLAPVLMSVLLHKYVGEYLESGISGPQWPRSTVQYLEEMQASQDSVSTFIQRYCKPGSAHDAVKREAVKLQYMAFCELTDSTEKLDALDQELDRLYRPRGIAKKASDRVVKVGGESIRGWKGFILVDLPTPEKRGEAAALPTPEKRGEAAAEDWTF